MSVLADTNILLRWVQPSHPLNAAATENVARLLASGKDVCFTPQNIAEFWNVATRPVASNGLGLDVAAARRGVELIEEILTLLPETPAVYAEWKRLVIAHGVAGVRVHDARLVASMNAHGVRTILTFNTDDFLRYTTDNRHPIKVLHPSLAS